jgi:formylglycine-generating enzyme
MAPGCCPASGPKGPASKSAPPTGGQYPGGMVDIPGGTALIGTDTPEIPIDSESPLRRVKLKPFCMATTAVTNAEFADFIAATGYETEAERFGWSFVFWMQVPENVGPTEGVAEAQWWRRVDGATWAAPNGPETEDACHPDHPVVQVSWNDARAYAEWVGGRLPSEAEWEHAARGGLGDVRFPWGQAEPDDTETLPCNIWQGRFPDVNTAADGYVTTAPARAFRPNGYGLFNMAGNVWEWTGAPYKLRSMRREARAHMAARKGFKLLKGGSFLCHRSYCYRYRIAARIGNSPDSSTTHQGFRVVFDG